MQPDPHRCSTPHVAGSGSGGARGEHIPGTVASPATEIGEVRRGFLGEPRQKAQQGTPELAFEG